MSALEQERRWRAPRAILWTAFLLRVAVVLAGHTYRVRTDQQNFNFAFEAGRIARSLATGHGYANPFNGQSGPTAWLTPLYPLLVALAFKLFGVYTRGAALFLMVCDSFFSALAAPAVYEIAARCFDAKGLARRASRQAAPVALWSAWMWAVYPAFLQYAIHWLWEMSLTTCLFAWAMVVALRLREARGQSAGPGTRKAGGMLWVWFGGLWGLIALSNASLMLVMPAMMIWIAWGANRDEVRWWVAGAATACVVFAMVLAPWVARNERVMHAPVLTRDNFGVELYDSTLEANEGMPWGTSLPLSVADPEFQQYVRMGELKFAQMRGRQGMERIRERPGEFARWTMDRFLFFWDGTPHPPDRHPAQEFFRQLSYSFLSYAGLLGLGRMLRRRVEGAGMFAAVFALLPLPYYLVSVQPRFRHPMEPLIAILMVYLFRSAETRRGEQGLA